MQLYSQIGDRAFLNLVTNTVVVLRDGQVRIHAPSNAPALTLPVSEDRAEQLLSELEALSHDDDFDPGTRVGLTPP